MKADVALQHKRPLISLRDTSAEYHFSTDDQLRIVGWDEKTAELTGRSPAQVIGKNYWEIFPRIVTEEDDAVRSALRSGRDLLLERHSFDCLLGRVSANVQIRPVVQDDVARSADVTMAFESVCPLAERFSELQQFIDIGKTASTLAHGVRNPLNAIKGAVVYLRDRYPDEQPMVEFMKIIEYEISRLDTFISKFLSASVSEVELQETDVNAIMERIKVVISFQASASRVHVVYETADIPRLQANPFQLEQAILNVINNALRAMSSGGLLRIRSYCEEKNGAGFAVIEVSDTGPGILESRIGTVTAKSADGKGFGLFITNEILKHHGGHLQVSSRKGSGTTMRMYLPL